MLKGIFGTNDNGSEMSSSSKRKSKRRDGDEEEGSQISRRSRADSTGTSSTSKRKSSRRESTEQSSGFHPSSTAFSSTSRSPYADVAAPSVASSYATAYTEPSNASIRRPEVVRNESMVDKLSRSERSNGSKNDGKRESRGDTSRSIDEDDKRRNAGQSKTSRRDSRRKPSRKDTATRAAEEHDNSLPHNQFPGQEPAGFTVASPYRPTGLASDYYGDHGESISEQPGVRPDRPSILISADQAHLLEPTIESHPPTEPSSLGHVGAAAEFFGGEIVAEPMTSVNSSRPGRENNETLGRRPSLKAPGKDSTAQGASPRSSPGPDPRRRPISQSQNSNSIGIMGAGAAPLAAGAMAAGVGAAADYYTGNIAITPHDQPLPSGVPGRPDEVVLGSGQPYARPAGGSQSQSYCTTTENMQTTSSTITSSSRPPRPSQSSGSNMPLYGAAAAAAGVAGAAYLAHEHTSAQHEQAFNQSPTDYQGHPSDMPFRPGQNQTQNFGAQQQQQQQQQIHRRRTGAFGKFVDWFQDPVAVAEYEAYTEAIGVCKYCFEPGTTPAEAPRKHYYRRRRPSSGSRYGSSTRVDKLTRYSSDENLRRRNSRKGYSTTERVLATGLAGVGAAAVAGQVYKNKNDFNDTYSVKSGQPDHRSRVSFQEDEGERYSTSKRTSRRESEGLSRRESDRRRQSGSEGEVRYEKRSSRRRDSSGSGNRATARGGNLSTPVALAGAAAVGAALASSGSRRRSRSRSKSPRKNRKGYYSKRVSPKHSYVDLNQTLEDSPSGLLGLGGFFSSPSSNSKQGKTKKGLFNFSNNSTSSSDADLVFGEGTVRRKNKRGRRDDRKGDHRQSGMGDTAAILGLAATGAALAAETRRRDDKGKRKEDRRTDSDRCDDDRKRRSSRDRRDDTNKIKLQGYQDSADNGDEGAWEDASDDDRNRIDMGLVYGGRLSSRASKESLNEGINILGWRFGGNQKKREEEKRVRRQSSKPDLSGYDPVKTGLVAGAAGLAGAAAANYYSRPGPVATESPPKNMPPLRYVDPVPVDSREQTPRKQSMQSSVSPTSFPPQVTRISDASLEHPQPVTPISKDVYQRRQSHTDGPSGPVVFDKPRRDSRGHDTSIIAAAGTAAALGAAAIAIGDAEREHKRDDRRSATIPTSVPSLKDGVSFDLTNEQEDREQRRERKRREKEVRRASEAAAAKRDATPRASIITGPERSPERKLETWRLRDAVKAGGPGSMEPPIREPSPQASTKDLAGLITQPLPTPERETRLSEIDRQLEELYAQHREQEARKSKDIEAAGLAAAAVAVGAGVIASTSDSASKGEDKPRRKSSLRKSSKYRDQDVETESAASTRFAPSASASDTATESAAERLARKAARRVQNQRAPSPAHQHDDYTAFFVPPELKDRMAEHNRESEVNEAKIVDIVPGMRRADTFPDELYHAYGTEDTDIPPMKLPWKVPMLGLVSPTPPPRSPSITAEKSPIILATSGSKDIGEPDLENVDPRDVEPRRSNSKVTWGDHEINVYEVITPEYERDGHDFTTSSPESSAKKELPISPLRQAYGVDDVETSRDTDMDQPVLPVEKMTTEQGEHVASGKDFADLPPSRDITRDMPEVAPLVEERKPSSAKSTPAVQFEQFNPAGSTISQGSFYQSPFASTVSDLDLPITSSSSRVPADGMNMITESPKEEMTEERVSKSERRRRERAEATSEPEKVVPETSDIAEPYVPGGFDDAPSDVNVFDYMVTSNGSTLPSASTLGAAATSVLASDLSSGKEPEGTTASTTRDLPVSAEEADFAALKRTETFDESAFVDSFATPKRADTFDEGALIDSFATPKRGETFAEGDFTPPKSRNVTSDPEDWEKTSSSLKKNKKPRDDDYYESSKSSSKKRSKRDSQIFNDPDPDDDAKSTVSTPADLSRPRSKRKGSSSSARHDDDDHDDRDSRSVISDARSAGSGSTSTGKEKRRSKEKDREKGKESTSKKSGWALLGGLIGAAGVSKSDLSGSGKSESEGKRKKGGEEKEKKRKGGKRRESVDDDGDDRRRSRSASQSSSAAVPPREREESVDETFVSADENGANGDGDGQEDGHRDGPVNAKDMDAQDVNVDTDADARMAGGADESFLATRPELPTLTNTKPTATESLTETEIGTGARDRAGAGASGLPTVTHADAGFEHHDPASIPLPTPESSTRNLEPASGTVVATGTPEPEQADLSISTPRQRRLSNLRTTDLGSSPTINSPARLGRFPVSPGVIRPGSVGSPPTSFPAAFSASTSSPSPLSTPRTRQGRPSSTDFRSGKEFRPLYLVERHSATKSQNRTAGEGGEGEVEETYPSLPSSRTSSAHPSLENLRGEYEYIGGDVDAGPQQFQPREPTRRFSWSDSHQQNVRTRSPAEQDDMDSGDVTPTQESFPVDVGVSKKEKSKPKYEFHSPSELLEDPARHQGREGEGEVPESTDELVGSPLPSVLGTETEGSSSPVVEESRSRSRSRSSSAKDVTLGLGLGAGLVGVAAAAGAFDRKLESNDEDNHEEFTPQPMERGEGLEEQSGTKTRRVKDWEGHDGPDPDAERQFQLQAKAALAGAAADALREKEKEDNESTQTQTRGLEAAVETAIPTQEPAESAEQEPESEREPVPEPEDEWATPSKKSKKSKKDKGKKSSSGSNRKDSLPLLDTTSTEADSGSASAPADRDLKGEDQAKPDPTPPILDVTDPTANLDEGTSHASFPFDAPPTEDNADPMDRSHPSSPIPSQKLTSSNNAFETAFEAARAVRGLPDGVTRESAMDELFASPPTATNSLIKPVDIRDIPVEESEKNPFGDDYEIGTSSSRDMPGSFGQEESSRGDDAEVAPDEFTPVQNEDKGERLPTIPEEDAVRSDLSKEIREDAEAEAEKPSEPVDEIAWAQPGKKSKKDKGKNKSRVIDDIETETSTPDTSAETQPQVPAAVDDEPVKEETRDLVVPPVTAVIEAGPDEKTPAEPVDEFAWAPPGKKSKKDKKSNRKSRTIDDFDTPTPVTGAEDTRDLVIAEPGSEADPLDEAQQIVRAAQEPSAVQYEEAVGVGSVQPLDGMGVPEEEIAWAPSGKKGRGTDDFELESQDAGEQAMVIDKQDQDEARDVQAGIPSDDPARDVVIQTAGEAQITEEPVLEPAEDDWAVPVKKSKKEKKSKRKSTALDDVEPESQTLEAVAPQVVGGDDNQSREVQETVQQTELEEVSVVEEPKTIEDELIAPVKKSKKEKKSKRKSTVFEDVEHESQSLETAAPEVAAGGDDQSRDMQEFIQPIDREDKVSAVEEPTLAEETMMAEKPATVEDLVTDEWAVPGKKSKKDKKSKKKATVVDDIEPESPATTSQAPADEESQDVRETTPVTEALNEIPPIEVPRAAEDAVEDAWAVPAKKSKKEKKSKKSFAVFDGFESESPATGSQTPANEEGRDLQETAPITDRPEQLEPAEDPKPAEELVEDEWAAPAKKSKKDKKSKRRTLDFDSAEPTETSTPVSESRDIDQDESSHLVTEEPEQLPPAEELKRAEEPVEDEWAASTKKSKKDKKSKRKTLDFDSIEPAETSTPTPESRDMDQDESLHVVSEKPVEVLTIEELYAAQEPAKDEWAVPTKKSKKSKRKTLDSDSAEPTETSTPTSESRDIDKDESLHSVAASTAGLAAGALAGLAGASLISEDQEKPVEDEEWAPTSSKKSKKDKKSKKKGMAFSPADDEEQMLVADTSESKREVEVSQGGTTEEQAGATEDPATVDEVERSPSSVEKLNSEEEPLQSIVDDRKAPVQEDEWAAPMKKSKKDKKSKKKGSLALLEEDQPAEETHQREQAPEGDVVDQPSRVIAEEDFPVAPAAAHVDEVTGHYFGMLKDYQPVPGAPDNQAAETSRGVAQDVLVPADEAREVDETKLEHPSAGPHSSENLDRDGPAIPSSNPPHDFPVVAEVAHVDDVVSFHYDMLKDYKPEIASTQKSKEIVEQILPNTSETAEQILPNTPEAAEQILPNTSEAAASSVPVDTEEDAWAVPVKKSKKDKKKRQSVVEEEQPDAVFAPPEASHNDFVEDTLMADEPRELTTSNPIPADQPMGTDPATTAEPIEPSLAEDEDLYPATSKKSKKDKKKNRQSAFEEEQPDADSALPEASEGDFAESAQTTDEPTDLITSNAALDDQLIENSSVTPDEPVEPLPTNEEDQYPVTSKKSKKDKKKKHHSTLKDYEEPSTEQSKEISESDASVPITAGVGVAALGAGILASNQEAGAEELAAPETTALEEESTPSSSKKSKKGKKKRQSTFDVFDDAPAALPAVGGSRDVAADDVVQPADMPDTAVPSEKPEEVIETPAEIEEQPFEFSTKKSKKDKKNKRQSTFDDLNEEKTASPAPEQSRAVTIDDIVAPADFIDTAVPSERPQDDVETPAETEEQPFEFTTKKSKKDKKKKRGSTFDDFDTAQTAAADDLGTSAPVAEMETVPESRRNIDETVAPAEDKTTVMPGNKSKKGKKKQQQSILQDVEMEEPAALTIHETSFDDPSVEADTAPETKELETPTSNTQEPVLGDDGWPIEQAAAQATPAKEEEWAVPTKKSKKDKKKKNTLLSWADGEDSTSQPTESSTPGEPTEARDVEMQEPTPTIEGTAIKSDAQPAIVMGSMSNVAAQPDGEEDHAMTHQRRQSKLAPGGWGEEEKRPIVDTPMIDEPTRLFEEPFEHADEPMQIVEEPEKRDVSHDQQEVEHTPEDEDVRYVVKQSKKDKKGKKSRKSEAYSEEPETREVDESQIEAAPEPLEQAQVENVDDMVIEEAGPEDEWGYSSKKSKKDKTGKENRESEAYSEEPETREVDESQIAASPNSGPLEQPQVENMDDEAVKEAKPEADWGFASKKSRKDKNKKGRNALDEEVAAPDILAVAESSQESSSRDVGGEDEWAASTKKSKKDKNVKPILEEEVVAPEVLTIPETSQESSQESSSRDIGGEDEWAVPIKKSKKDKKSKRQSTRDVVGDTQPEESLAFPVNDADHVDDVAGHYHGMLREYRPAEGAPDNKSLAASRVVNEPEVPHIDDVTGHYYGMLREYQPAEGAPDNKPATSKDAQRAERVPSPISDEETRRARRVRRKASPVYRGEEPEDLPGHRSLTPPADHDDMMTTALGVAAGLGLTGAAAGAASIRPGVSDSRSVDDAQAAAPTAQAPSWSFAKMKAPGDLHQVQRDSGVQFADSPTLPHEQFDSRNRDSGYVKSPANRDSWEGSSRDTGMLGISNRPPRPQSPTSSSEDVSGKRSKRLSRDTEDAFTRREPSPVLSTSKDRSSKLFTSPPSIRVERLDETPRLGAAHLSEPTTDIHRSPSIHGHHRSREELRARSPASSGPRHVADTQHEQSIPPDPHRSIFGPYPTQENHERDFSPPKTPLHTISEHSQDTSPSLQRQLDMSDVGESQPRKAMQHHESGRNLRDAASIAGGAAIGTLAARELSRDDQLATRAKSLGKSKANTKSARSLRRANFDPDVVPSSSAHDPSEGRSKEAAHDMSDVYDGHGEYPGSPMSPTRPPSMRKRQSMQQIKDLETRLDQLAAENRNLAEAKIIAERHLEDTQLERHRSGYAGQEAVETANLQLREKDEAIARLQQELEGIKQDHARLSDVNAGLSNAHENLRMEHEQRYSQLEDLHAETHENWQESSRELETLRGQHTELSGGMEDIVRHEIDTALAEKNIEIERLRSDLETAKEKISELEQQILSSGGDDILNFRDEDYFESACQSLCQHVQQWVLRFSKFSDTLVCRTTQQIRDEKLVDRFELAILDGSDVDVYLGDRIKRRDVFMSVVMTMIFEYIFTRYLFGMDRDQRQTLKKLEKNLSEVGERGAVHQWRAMTLTLLAKRQAFQASRENDTEAVVLQVYDTLAKFLPPPQNLQAQVQESLRSVMRTAADLSIEMRTQKAEYIMLPPLQPEYDTNGDLTRKVYFNASLMNERSGETSSNNELEAQHAVVRMVLFPLVVKKGNDDGEGEEEIVVCPAQVLVARPDRKSRANSGRVVSAQSDRMSVDQMSRANASRHSLAPSTMDMSNVI